MSSWLSGALGPPQSPVVLIWPFLFSLWMAAGDVWSRRIPNYLTVGTALAGLAFQWGYRGPAGLADGLLGMVLGFGLLILPYIWGGMGAGDVKALAALGAWLGPRYTIWLFCYMGLTGGLLALGLLCWRGVLAAQLRQGWASGCNLILCRLHGVKAAPPRRAETRGLPYGVAISLGMALLVYVGGG